MGFKIFDSDNARDYLYCRNHPWVLLEVLERGEHISGLHPTTCETKGNQIWRYIPAKIRVLISTFKFYFRHSSLLIRHSSFNFDIQVLNSPSKY